MVQSNDISMTLDPEIREALDAYAKRFFPNRSGKGNRTEAARQTLQLVMRLAANPDIQKVLDNDIALDGDILVFLRTTVSFYLKNAFPAEQPGITHTLE